MTAINQFKHLPLSLQHLAPILRENGLCIISIPPPTIKKKTDAKGKKPKPKWELKIFGPWVTMMKQPRWIYWRVRLTIDEVSLLELLAFNSLRKRALIKTTI